MSKVFPFRFDFASDASREVASTRTVDATFNPPGFSSTTLSLGQRAEEWGSATSQQEHLVRKRAWDVATAPARSIPMNVFVMYMAGQTVSIFPIMMVAMMLWRPIRSLFSVDAVFEDTRELHEESLFIHKVVFLLGHLGTIALAVLKIHSMGLLPNTPSDWLEFMQPPRRLQYAITSPIFV